MTTNFTDREKQVIEMALAYALPVIKERIAFGGPHRPLNEFDKLKHTHTLAHIYTAWEKVSGKPPAAYFQNPNPSKPEQTQIKPQ